MLEAITIGESLENLPDSCLRDDLVLRDLVSEGE